MTTQAEILCAALAHALESAAEKEAPTTETPCLITNGKNAAKADQRTIAHAEVQDTSWK